MKHLPPFLALRSSHPIWLGLTLTAHPRVIFPSTHPSRPPGKQ